jgi:hypothetical protein
MIRKGESKKEKRKAYGDGVVTFSVTVTLSDVVAVDAQVISHSSLQESAPVIVKSVTGVVPAEPPLKTVNVPFRVEGPPLSS